jgi:hypothetical protein
VPEALARTLAHLRSRFGAATVDRMWIFPPLRRGRRERGLVAVSLFLDGTDRRRLITVAYNAERTGRSLTVEHKLHEEGEAPRDLLPRVMEGVAKRAGDGHGEPRTADIGGSETKFDALEGEQDTGSLVMEQT